MKLSSFAFSEGQRIPPRYSRDGEDINPPLLIEGVPPTAESLVLLVDDPDAPGRLFNHWIVFNIPPGTTEIPEGTCPINALQGRNDYGEECYGGPQPPSGEHRYFFKIYALDKKLSLPSGAKREAVYKEMHGHILDETQLMGRFPSVQLAPNLDL